MKVSLPDKVTGARDALFVLEVEFPVATAERTVEVSVSGPVEPLDLSGSSRGGTYRIPVGLERLHVPMRVLEDGDAEALVTVTCLEGPEATLTDAQRLKLEAPGAQVGGGGRKRLLLGALALAAVAIGAFALAQRGSSDTVPDVRGRSEAEARKALTSADYTVRPTYDRTAETDSDGLVLRQSPAGGVPAPGDRIVEIVIGQAVAEAAVVPPVVGDTVESAERTLEGLGYQVIVTEQDNDEPRMTGRVLSQLPEAGQTLEPGEAIEVVIARAPAFVLLPELVGRPRDEAERILADLGLLADIGEAETAQVRQDGTIIEQTPLPGSQLDVGARVTIVVGRASAEPEWSDPAGPPEPASAAPPGAAVAAADPDTAPDPLPRVPSPADPATPAQPAPAEPSTSRTASVTPGGSLERDTDGRITIPDFRGWTKEEAEDSLRGAGLQPIITLAPATAPHEQGCVMRQRPAAGAQRSGGMVFLTVGEGTLDEAATPPPAQPVAAVPRDPPAPADPLAADEATDPLGPTPAPEDGPSGPSIAAEPATPEPATAEPTPADLTPVPDVVGLQQVDAEALLVDLGFIARTTPQPTEYPPAGTVLGQDPAPGEALARGAEVRLDVAAALGALAPRARAPGRPCLRSPRPWLRLPPRPCRAQRADAAAPGCRPGPDAAHARQRPASAGRAARAQRPQDGRRSRCGGRDRARCHDRHPPGRVDSDHRDGPQRRGTCRACGRPGSRSPDAGPARRPRARGSVLRPVGGSGWWTCRP